MFGCFLTQPTNVTKDTLVSETDQAKEGPADQQHLRFGCWWGQDLHVQQESKPVFPIA